MTVNVGFYCNYCIYNDALRQWKRVYCVILNELSVFTLFLSNKREKILVLCTFWDIALQKNAGWKHQDVHKLKKLIMR